jgi:hypothetical protein
VSSVPLAVLDKDGSAPLLFGVFPCPICMGEKGPARLACGRNEAFALVIAVAIPGWLE